MSDELLFSPEAAATRYLFYQDLNEINLFIEDEGKEYEYETIFKRLLGAEYTISAIFALGGKPNVVAKFEEFGEISGGIENYYLVDGDFDRYLRPTEMVQNSHFIYLDRYNIESYFLDKVSCEQFAKGKLKCLDEEAQERVQFSYWKRTIIEQASKLFFCYCYIQKHHPEIENVDRSPYKFIDQKTGFERNDGSYQKYRDSLDSLDPDVENKIQDIVQAYKSIYGEEYLNLICGKFLFTSLYCHLRAIIKRPFEKDDLRWYLIEHFDISCLSFVKDKICSVKAA